MLKFNYYGVLLQLVSTILSQGVEEELIAELVDQCCNYHNFAMAIIDSTSYALTLSFSFPN